MADEEKKDKKIFVDEDWKEQAQKEKEELAAAQKAEQDQDREDEQEVRELPPADFSGLVSMLATQAFYSLGLLRAEGEQEREPDFVIAKYNIDMLGVIEEKTKGNISDEEKQMLETTLNQLRMAFVQISQQGE